MAASRYSFHTSWKGAAGALLDKANGLLKNWMSTADTRSGGGWITFNIWGRDEDQLDSSQLNSTASGRDPENDDLKPAAPTAEALPRQGERERGQKARHMLRSKPYPGDAQAVAEPWELLQAAAQSIYFWDAEVTFCSRGAGHGWIWSVPPWEAPPLVRMHPKWKQGGALSTVAKIRKQLPATC